MNIQIEAMTFWFLFELLVKCLLTAQSDPGVYMYNQAKYGSVDVITGDYLAGM